MSIETKTSKTYDIKIYYNPMVSAFNLTPFLHFAQHKKGFMDS